MPAAKETATIIMMRRTREDDIQTTYPTAFAKTRNRGQVAVEYILLLSVGVTIAAVIVAGVVSRDPQSPGFLMAKWRSIIELIGSDPIER